MKLSMKVQDDHHHPPPLLLRAKLPISILNLRFLSHFTTSTTNLSQLALSLATNFSCGPSLKLSYATGSPASAAASLTVTLKSGSGLFGSPRNSPLIISACFSYNPSIPNNPNPTFSIFFKPQLGSFSLRKSTSSHPKSDISSIENTNSAPDSSSYGFVPLEKPATATNFPLGKNDQNSIFKGVQLAAATQLPVAKKVALNLRWWVKIPDDVGLTLPVLRINKIGIQSVDDDNVLKEDRISNSSEDNWAELEMLKSICFWMKRDLDALSSENQEMKTELLQLKTTNSSLTAATFSGTAGGGFGKGVPETAFSASSGSEKWRSKRNDVVEDNSRKKVEKKNSTAVATGIEDELQRAIKAAAAAAASP